MDFEGENAIKSHTKRFRVILHLDMDAFYPSVEVLDHPELRGKSVIVGGSPKRGVVSSASYEARKFGVHSAQPMATAMRQCPSGVFMPVRMARYREISKQIFEIFGRVTPLVEPFSIDEAFLDVTGSKRLMGGQVEIAKKIKQTVFHEIGLTVSAGVAPSKFVAKIASDMEKPDGLTVVSPDEVRHFLNPLPIEKMWGVGKVTREILARLNVRNFEDLTRVSLKMLERRFGRHGRHMYQLARGIDDREVIPEHEIKSVGHEDTFMEDIVDADEARRKLLALSNKTAQRMRRYGVKGKTVTLKIKTCEFKQKTRSETLADPIDDGLEIYKIVCRLLEKTPVGKTPVRLLGVSLSHLVDFEMHCQLSLFNQETITKRRRLLEALDALHEKHGDNSIRPGILVGEE